MLDRSQDENLIDFAFVEGIYGTNDKTRSNDKKTTVNNIFNMYIPNQCSADTLPNPLLYLSHFR